MLTDKTILVRKHILDCLEAGDVAAGDRIPPARDLAVQLGVTFLKVQQAVETLVQDGILETRSRQGTFVRAGWEERVLADNLIVFNHTHRLPWLKGLSALMADELPGLRTTHAFRESILELRTTLTVQRDADQYLDLSDIFAECCSDSDDFFPAPFLPLQSGEKLLGIPFIFSPRVVYLNVDHFHAAGLEVPTDGWDWSTFLTSIRRLRSILPHTRILNWYVQSHLWLNMVVRGGGHLFDPQDPDRIMVDSEATRESLARFRDLGDRLDFPRYDADAYDRDFLDGKAAMIISGRQYLNNLRQGHTANWTTVPMPRMPGGVDLTSQATDVLCVRKSCIDMGGVRDYVRFMLSPTVQNYIGAQGYGIPIRRSAADASLDADDPRDALFIREMRKLGSEPLVDCPGVMNFLLHGVDRILLESRDIESETTRLATAAREILGIHRFRQDRLAIRASGGDELAITSQTVATKGPLL